MLLFFGDNRFDFHGSIVELYRRSKDSALLRGLLVACSDALQYSLSEVCAAERECFGSFDDLLELSEQFSRRDEEDKDDAVYTVLQCASQLGWLLLSVAPAMGSPHETNVWNPES